MDNMENMENMGEINNKENKNSEESEKDNEEREVSEEEAESLCEEKEIYWGGECSAKDFTEKELNELFTKYTEEIYKKVGQNIIKAQKVEKPDKPKKSKC